MLFELCCPKYVIVWLKYIGPTWSDYNLNVSSPPHHLSFKFLPSPSFPKLTSLLCLAQRQSHHYRVANPSLIPPSHLYPSLLIPNSRLKHIINPKSKLPNPKFTKINPKSVRPYSSPQPPYLLNQSSHDLIIKGKIFLKKYQTLSQIKISSLAQLIYHYHSILWSTQTQLLPP